MLDSLAPATAGVALHAHLLEHARRELSLDGSDAVTAADVARINLTVGAACSLTVLADMLLVPGKLGRGAVVKVAEGDLDSDLDVVSSRFARGSS